MASERTKEFREWATLVISALTLIAVPVGALILKNFRLEMREEFRREYVSLETFKASQIQIELLNAKLDKLQIQMVRLTDAVKLRDP